MKWIKLKQFHKLFEDEWPENDPACRPYTDEEIEQTYYTANNYLKGADPRAKELDALSRRIHFSESIAIVLVLGGVLLIFFSLPDRGGLLRGAGPGPFEASGVAWLEAGLFSSPELAVVSDNSQDITIHDLDGNLLQILSLPDAAPDIADLEEIATAPDGSHFLLGSHSTSNQMEKAARQHLIRIDVTTQKRSIFRDTAANTNFSISNEFEEIDLKEHLSNTCFAPDKCLRRGWKETKPSRCCDVNIEALAVSSDGADLYLGFREPVKCDEDKNKKPAGVLFPFRTASRKMCPAYSRPNEKNSGRKMKCGGS